MIASMTENGIIIIKPESAVEAFALKTWREKSAVQFDERQRERMVHWRGSQLVLEPLDAPAPCPP